MAGGTATSACQLTAALPQPLKVKHAHAQGGKKGETWSVDGGGHRYQRWWGEEHFGNGWVRRFGNSTTGMLLSRGVL